MIKFLVGLATAILATLIGGTLLYFLWYKPMDEAKTKSIEEARIKAIEEAKPKVQAQLTFTLPSEPKHYEETKSKEKLMVYPFDVKIINTGNVPITIIRVIPQYWLSSLENPNPVDALYGRKLSGFDNTDIPPGGSKTVPTIAFIKDTVIENNEVNIQAKVFIQGHKFPEQEAVINVFSLLSNGQIFYKSKKPRIIDFK